MRMQEICEITNIISSWEIWKRLPLINFCGETTGPGRGTLIYTDKQF
jgi:hypothetical protein